MAITANCILMGMEMALLKLANLSGKCRTEHEKLVALNCKLRDNSLMMNEKGNKMTFNFYTYDRSGKDIIIKIQAEDEDHAWDIFEAQYPLHYVDQVIRA
jgi:hypothetical protein